MAAPTFTKTGTKAAVSKTLPNSVFSVSVDNHELIKEAYVGYLANGRQNLAVTKKRGEVSGGGKKPWRQKGTGRARFGSSRNPIWRGGGIAFGPTGNESYSRSMSVSSKRQALRQALTLKEKADEISVIETIEIKSGKTSDVVKLLQKLGAKGNTLIVLGAKDDLVVRASANLPKVIVTTAQRLTTYDVINSDSLILVEDSIKVLENRLVKATEAKK